MLEHPDDADLTAHVLAAAAKPGPGEGWRFVKRRQGGAPIDACSALAMATRAALARRRRPPIFKRSPNGLSPAATTSSAEATRERRARRQRVAAEIDGKLSEL